MKALTQTQRRVLFAVARSQTKMSVPEIQAWYAKRKWRIKQAKVWKVLDSLTTHGLVRRTTGVHWFATDWGKLLVATCDAHARERELSSEGD
jgi:Fe2+ or Zn2+ uptake regulation protein